MKDIMTHYTPRVQVIEELRAKLMEVEKELAKEKLEKQHRIDERQHVITNSGELVRKSVMYDELEKECDDLNRLHRREVHERAELQRTLDHRDNMIVKFYDMIRNDELSIERKLAIIKIVIDEDCDQDLDLTEQIIAEMFRKGLFR